MTNIETLINDFFAHEGETYVNPQAVEIARLGNTLCVSAFWLAIRPGEKVSLVLMVICDSYVEFQDWFGIEEDVKFSVDQITFGDLMNLHLTGKGAVSCSVDGVNAPSLEFYKQLQGLIARDEFENAHQVGVTLEKPEDFIEYTKKYYESNKHLDGFATFENWPWNLVVQVLN